MRIQHNIAAMNSYSNYANNVAAVNKNLEKLSSGYKINRAGDDAAGLAISEKMRAQITGLDAAQKNVKDGISLVKTAEGAMQEIQDMLNRMDYLATQSANGTYDNEVDRLNLDKEVSALKDEINRIADSANFNGIKLLDGSLGGGKISADGASFLGAEVAKYQEATVSVDLTSQDLSGGVGTDLFANVDTYVIDGNSITIDWANDTDAKSVANSMAIDWSASSVSLDQTKDFAKKLEELFNKKLSEAGYSSTVTIKATVAGKFDIASTNKTSTSEVSFAGSDQATAANMDKTVGAILFGSTAGESVNTPATKNYNGANVAAADEFTMTINGVQVNVQGVTATNDSGGATATDMDTVAANLQNAIRTAVGNYNTALGLTAGTKDPSSGLTGLTTTDFTVEEKDGAFLIKYNGDEDVTFSFSDVGDRNVAAALGLASGSSKSGGATGLTLQIGDTADSFNQMNVSVGDMHTRALGIEGITIANQSGAQSAIQTIKDAINYVSGVRGDLGAIQNRLEHTQNNLSVMEENIQDAESTIRDTDVAEEMMSYTKNNILVQSAQAMLAQANQIPQGVLQLLG